MSDFAKAQLLKFGWSEGKGLGKKEDGITQAVRPKLKFDTSGIGHKETDHEWWSSVYNKAASNIVLDKSTDKIAISVADKNAVNISAKRDVVPEKASLYHGSFLKTSTLQDGNLIKDSTCQTLEDKGEVSGDPFAKMTDEELFKACGGRTAHKGARHGLTLSGKLGRIAEQERQLMTGLKSCKKGSQGQEREKKKKKKQQLHADEDNLPPLDVEEDDDLVLPLPTFKNENYQPSKNTIKKNKRKVQDLAQQLNKTCMIQDNTVKEDEENSPQDTSEDSSQKKDKKKKKAKRKRDQAQPDTDTFDSDTSAACLLDNDVSMEPSSKKLKKSVKSNTCDTADPTHVCELCDEFYEHHKKTFEKHYKRLALERKKYKKNSCKSNKNAENDDFSVTSKKNKRKGKKHVAVTSTSIEAFKLNGRISKRKNKNIQKKEKKKRKNLILPATLQIDSAIVNFNRVKIGD